MTISTDTLEEVARRLFPDWSIDRVFAQLLLERAQKNLIRYQAAARQLEQKHGRSFVTFRHDILDSEPSEEVEQDYFDWELAVTGAEDMEQEIDRLRSLVSV